MRKDRILFIITPLLLGFLIGGFLFFNNNLQNFILNNSQDFSNLNVVWGKGSGEIQTLSSSHIFISKKGLKTKFNLNGNFKVSVDPLTERDNYMNKVKESAESCSDIKYDQIDKYKLRASDLLNAKVGDKTEYFLTFDKRTDQFTINHLIIKR